MSNNITLSIIVPVYNGEDHIDNCLKNILNQDFDETIEIIMVDDGSTDNSFNIIQNFKITNLKLFRLIKNRGASAARNKGLDLSSGEYVYFMDVDDSIDKDALKNLYLMAKKNDSDFVFSDFKRIIDSKNQRDKTFNYDNDKIFDKSELLQHMQKEINDPSLGHLGLFGCNGRLIKRSVIENGKIRFVEELRFLEDKTFCWDLFGKINNAVYIRRQLYSYYVYPDVQTAITKSINHGFEIAYFELITKKIENSFKSFGLTTNKIEWLVDQGLIFYIITLLVSYSRSMVLGKVPKEEGKKFRGKIIDDVLQNKNIRKAVKNYKISKKESQWIPKAINFGFRFFLELACDHRAKEVVKRRNTGQE
jgi:glycosyltransferase involved in cell wall biosynthesis